MKILVTGSAGFIGFHLTKALLSCNYRVVGIDNLNDYYDPELKKARLKELEYFANNNGFSRNYEFQKIDISEKSETEKLFNENDFDCVINLAAQAGVRYSLENPTTYANTNLVGFLNILEGCRKIKTPHLIYASSSSVYGISSKVPFSTSDRVDFPISLYAATKKSNELMAHAYSHLFGIPSTGLRFFTVYGPWGRPDMAYFSFTKKILKGEPIDIYNNGQMQRDFTYIDDIVESIVRITKSPPHNSRKPSETGAPYKIYNIGNNTPIELNHFIESIEAATNKKAIRNNKPMQAGDVPITYADVSELFKDAEFKPSTTIEDGIKSFVSWYKSYYLEEI